MTVHAKPFFLLTVKDDDCKTESPTNGTAATVVPVRVKAVDTAVYEEQLLPTTKLTHNGANRSLLRERSDSRPPQLIPVVCMQRKGELMKSKAGTGRANGRGGSKEVSLLCSL